MARSFSHWTPRYIKDRIALALEHRAHPDHPWLTAAAVEMLESALRGDDRALETGAGRSTRWFARRVAHLISLETNAEWFKTVTEQTRDLQNVDLRLIEDDAAYVQAIEALEDQSLEFALIDGPVRDGCAIAALTKVKPGGLLMVDNIDRYLPSTSRSPHARQHGDGCATPLWQEFSDQTADWRRFWSSNGVTDTCLWIVPG